MTCAIGIVVALIVGFGLGVAWAMRCDKIEHSDEPPQRKKSLFQKLIGR